MSDQARNSKPARPSAKVIRLPVKPARNSVAALILLANRLGEWRKDNPAATFEEEVAAGQRIAKELGT